MANTDNEKKALKLAEEMKELLEKWIAKNGPECAAAMKRVSEIKEEIDTFGFWVNWKVRYDAKTRKVTAEVEISKPRPDLTPEEQAIYDIWFKKMNGIE